MTEVSDIIKITAIVSLTLIEIANLLTLRYDGAFLGFVISIIAYIAGYEHGKHSKTS